MCTIPPTPPPPPPPPIIPDINANTTQISKEVPVYNTDSCLWASEYPELQATCAKCNICINKAPYKFKYKYLDSIMQVGPTCGIVAVSMLVNGQISPPEILDISKQEGYTCNGEMFSCKNMGILVEKVFSLVNISDISCKLKCGGLFSLETIEGILDGAVLLVPYDADCNHSPCLRNGHTAHWAVVCGIIIVDDPGESYSDPKNVYVLCKHGKSKYLTVWSLAELEKSNKNLMEFSPKKGADGLTYILPDGGIGGSEGLRDQFLMIEGL